MKTIVSLLFLTALVSCKKTTTTPTTNSTNNTTDIGLAYVDGNYDNGQLAYLVKLGVPNDSNITASTNFNVDIKYLGNNYVDFKLNTSLKLPSYLKHFQIKMEVYLESIQSSTNGNGLYTIDNTMFMDLNLNSIVVNHLVGVGGLVGMEKPTFSLVLQKYNSPKVQSTLTVKLFTEKGEELLIIGCVRKK